MLSDRARQEYWFCVRVVCFSPLLCLKLDSVSYVLLLTIFVSNYMLSDDSDDAYNDGHTCF